MDQCFYLVRRLYVFAMADESRSWLALGALLHPFHPGSNMREPLTIPIIWRGRGSVSWAFGSLHPLCFRPPSEPVGLLWIYL